MNDEQSCLDAIRDRPGSCAERLVYADWLSDRGDPRGAFIHHQCRAARLPAGSPERAGHEAEAEALLMRHEEEWLGPMLKRAGNWHWRDGLLDWVTFYAEDFLAGAGDWLPRFPILGLHLRRAGPHAAALADCPQLAHVTALYLGDSGVDDAALAALLRSRHLHRVRSLLLFSNGLSPAGAAALAGADTLPRLRELNFARNIIGDEGVAELVRTGRLTRLRALDLSLTGVSEEGLRALIESPLLPRLRRLGLGLNLDLSGDRLAALANSPAIAGLRTLDCSMCQASDAVAVAFAASPHAAGLRLLGLADYMAAGDEALLALAGSPHLSRLRRLSVGVGRWTAGGVAALARSRHLPALRELHIEGAPAGAARSLMRRPLGRRLDTLGLSLDAGALRALAARGKPARLLRATVDLKPGGSGAWEEALGAGVLARLERLGLHNARPGAVRAMAVTQLAGPGRLPRLRSLGLAAAIDGDEWQALFDSPLWRGLAEVRLTIDTYRPAPTSSADLIRRLAAAWATPALRRLELDWAVEPDELRPLLESAPPPGLVELAVYGVGLGDEGVPALAAWPYLRRLRTLTIPRSNCQYVRGLRTLTESPHIGPLLRIDLSINSPTPQEDLPVLRARFGLRFAAHGRSLPRTLVIGGRLGGDDLD